MALGAITHNPVAPGGFASSEPLEGPQIGNSASLKVTNTSVVGDSSYPTGGSSLPASSLNLNTVVFAIASVQVVGANGPAEVYYDPTVNKLVCYTGTGQVANATNLSTATINIIAWGY